MFLHWSVYGLHGAVSQKVAFLISLEEQTRSKINIGMDFGKTGFELL
jgi:hypothetical protein